MLHTFKDDMQNSSKFMVTLELVPGTQPTRRKLDTVLKIAADALKDGRVSALSITDNPGGNPALAPDALGVEIIGMGMDAIVHFTCRDINRGGMQSRALQLAMVGMHNILALSGDYTSSGGEQGTPVFDLDSVSLICMLNMLKQTQELKDPKDLIIGCAVSPFKYTEAEVWAQYAKMSKKLAAGADYVITQLGFDVRKFEELIRVQKQMGCSVPTLASLYVLTPGAARMMNQGKIPGCVVSDELLQKVTSEWQNKEEGRQAALERAARLGVVLKGLGYRGVHIGGLDQSFDRVAWILDRMEAIEDRWREFLPEFNYANPYGYYAYPRQSTEHDQPANPLQTKQPISIAERFLFGVMQKMHVLFFSFDSACRFLLRPLARGLDKNRFGRALMHVMEHPVKILLFSCQRCGDCGLQHLAFQCPESGCPKHTRNGACGGSLNGKCEVRPEQLCVWVRAYRRWSNTGQTQEMFSDFVPPRMWELNHSSSWLNFHLGRDHQTASSKIAPYYGPVTCRLETDSHNAHNKH